MLSEEQLKLIIKALKDNFKKEEEKYKNAILSIQDLCPHNVLISIMVGNKCDVCGKLFHHQDNRLTKYKKNRT